MNVCCQSGLNKTCLPPLHPIMVVSSKKKRNDRFGVRVNCTVVSAMERKAEIVSSSGPTI